MDLGIVGRKAIVCASSRGLGRACAERLAEAGCEVVVNGLDPKRLDATAADIRSKTGAKVIAVVADVGTKRARRRSSPHVPNRTSWSPTMRARRFGTSANSTARR